MITTTDALLSLRPGAEWTITEDGLVWHDTNQTQPTEAEIAAEVARIEKTLEPQGQVCNGPNDLRSVPNLGGKSSLFFRRFGRRNILLVPLRRFKAPLLG